MTLDSTHFKMSERGESPNLSECTKKDETPPPSCFMETEDCHNNIKPNINGNHEGLKTNLKAKGKLVRSTAVCDESLLPTEENSKEKESETTISSNHSDSPECDEKEEGKGKVGTTTKKPSLSKEPSLEYTDSTGIDLEGFLITTLKSSPRDRLMLLKLEQDMIDFMTDNSSYKKFPQMSSYHRMLVHRVAAYFGLEHNVDHSGKAVIINKTSNSRIPEHRFAEHVQEEKIEERRLILKRDTSQDKEDSQLRVPLLKDQMRSKSIEEREEEYQRVRERIFSQDSSCVSQSVFIETRGLEDSSILSETQRRRQLFRGNRGSSGQLSGSRQSSFELDSHWNDPQPWSSTDSDSPSWTSKSTHSSSKLCKPVSESALSYTPPNNSPAYIIVPAESSIPPGSILLNPHTGQPFLNPDGTPAVYNPPVSQKPISNQSNTMQPQAPPPPPQQQTVASHGVPQVQYSSVTYLPPQHLNISTSQQHPIEQTREDLTSKFGHMMLSHQSSGDLPDMPSYYMQGAPPTHSNAQPHHSYAPCHHSDCYVSPGMTLAHPTALPPQTHGQQSNQVSVYSYPVQCPSASQQYGAATYSTQTGYPTVISNQQGCPGMMGSQILPQTQQGMIGSYPSVPSYQVPQQQQQQQPSYPSTMLVSGQGGQTQSLVPPAGVQVYCNSLPPSSPPPLSMLGVSFQSSSCKNGCNVNQNQCWY
ncbi:cAMP-regulated phosphoprotein 21-like isoform X2 [Xyrauchen texanus]|uniref:cAMP-regulated phosphoprotein 21-like isoform X2 n=1 Tax=Xyrauchen texanus TaxID=154827 RepID=UPI0022424B1F|nr:cAMP-regulated phosphoprotein 21-like isoform X2 [Xyrauchen texanus]